MICLYLSFLDLGKTNVRLEFHETHDETSHWALVNTYVFILSLAVKFLAGQLPKMNVSHLGFVAGHLE